MRLKSAAATLLLCIAAACPAATASAQTIPPWATTESSAWANEAQAKWITDMSRCSPPTALASTIRHGHWKLIPYQMKGGRKGVLAWTSATAKAPAVRIPLGVHGWYAIFVGVFSGAVGSTVWIKLDTDMAPLERSNGNSQGYGNFRDSYFKAADLRGDETIEFAPQTAGFPEACGIGYVKLIPLSEAEIPGIEADRADTTRRTMTFTEDGFDFMYARLPTTVEEMLAQVEPIRYTDCDVLLLQQFGGDKVNYPSAVGTAPGMDSDDWSELGHKNFVESIKAFAKQKINPTKLLIDGAHNCGVKVYVSLRVAGWSWAPPYDEFWETPFFKKHPEWYCVDRDGKVTTRMSWAVPEVRHHVIALFREMLRLGADGADVVFPRGVPVTLYEPAFRKLFERKYGIDLLTLNDTDRRILSLRSDIVTTFYTELRAMLDQEEQRRGDGKRLAASATAFGNDYDNSWYGIDIRRLVNAGLLDHIMIYPFDMGSRKGGVDYEWLHEVCDPKGVPWRVAGAFDTTKLLKYAAEAFDGGAPGISLFDAVGRDVDDWMALSRMGHRAEVRERLKTGLPQDKYYYLHTLGSKVMDGRFSPVGGG